MNIYRLFCSNGKTYLIKASYSCEAINKLKKFLNIEVNSWECSIGKTKWDIDLTDMN